ncbi:hypothetical protein LSTR_LSTR010968 [Laodelphax striatellus]|uniref:ZP domain-containing protein n=1 Tax=Laodelphax striatellus TaxID=195883 RepID=A0A482XIS3_LAOST|nr:hypothetical protein LSTR_LSTR010968 [Laodelphax striatellus]
MPARHTSLWNIILFVVFGLNHILSASDSLYYNIHTLEEHKVCNLGSGFKYITKPLIVGETSAVIIKQTSYFREFSGNDEFKCTFVVKASFENFGIFGVIQKLKLRKDVEANKCIDYVEVCEYRENPIERVSGIYYPMCRFPLKRFCGLPSESTDDDVDTLKPAGFIAKRGQIAVKIYLAAKRVEPNQTMDVVIAFTSFIPCRRDMGSNKMCSPPVSAMVEKGGGEGACISKVYFNDGVVNCPYSGCADECGAQDAQAGAGGEPSLSTKVTVTAVTSIFLSFFFFLGCIWLCRSCEVLCWSVDGLRHAVEVRNNAAAASMTQEDELTPTAPLPPPAAASDHDKDLPPAYETLFPDR